MSEYYFVRENGHTPMYEASDKYEEAVCDTRFTFPKKTIPILAGYKLEHDYEIPDIILYPGFCISLNLYNSIDLKNIYGGNWISILLKDKGKHEFMMLQLSNELDVIDREKSEFEFEEEEDDGEEDSMSGMEILVIDPDKLENIPLYKRLIFQDKSWGFHTFFHKTIVEKIMSMDPTGIKFVPIDQYNDSWTG